MDIEAQGKEKVAAAIKASEEVLQQMGAAAQALRKNISVNGYGIFHDRQTVRNDLLGAKAHLDQALATIQQVSWPSDADYDHYERSHEE